MRKSWDHHFMDMAYLASSRGTCPRKRVGCVIVRDNRVISTGYNGSMPGQPHCDDAGCLYLYGEDAGCQRTNHAEANAIAQAARFGISVEGATCYVTMSTCYTCLKLLISSGITRVVYHEAYRKGTKDAEALARTNGVVWQCAAFYERALPVMTVSQVGLTPVSEEGEKALKASGEVLLVARHESGEKPG